MIYGLFALCSGLYYVCSMFWFILCLLQVVVYTMFTPGCGLEMLDWFTPGNFLKFQKWGGEVKYIQNLNLRRFNREQLCKLRNIIIITIIIIIIFIKGTVSLISSDLLFLKWHVRFTTRPFKPLFNQGFRRYSYLYSMKLIARNRSSVH